MSIPMMKTRIQYLYDIWNPTFDQIASDDNNTFDPSSEDMEEVEAIVDRQFIVGILELSVRYSTDELTWHLLDLVKDIDPHTIAHYVIANDLGPILNGKHRHWAHGFLCSLKRTLRRLRRCHTIGGYETSTYHPLPKNRHSRCANKATGS